MSVSYSATSSDHRDVTKNGIECFYNVSKDKLGEGTFGTVFKAVDKQTKEVVALKRIPFTQEDEEGIPSTALREIAYLYELKDFKHASIIDLKDVHTQINPKGGVLHLVFECMD